MIKLTIPKLPGMKYQVELNIRYAGWASVLRQMFWPLKGER